MSCPDWLTDSSRDNYVIARSADVGCSRGTPASSAKRILVRDGGKAGGCIAELKTL